jgi:hypothetical protein
MRNTLRLFTVLCFLTAGAVHAAPSNDGAWGGAWTNLQPTNMMGQVLIAESSSIWAVDVDLLTANPGIAPSDTLTLTLVDAATGVELAHAADSFADGFDGWARFGFGRKVPVKIGQKLIVYVRDTGTILLGWKYGVDAYANGYAIRVGTARPTDDFRFRVNP